MTKKIIIIGSGNSGSGAIFDYLAGKAKNLSLLNGKEFRITHDTDGLNDLFINNYNNFTINNSASSFERFEKYFTNSFKNNKNKNNLHRELKTFLNQIIYLKYYGLPSFVRNKFSLNKKIKFYFDRLVLKKNINNIKLFRMTLPVNKKLFLNLSSKFINNIIKILHPKSEKFDNIIINQGGSFWCPNESAKFYDNKKIIVVSRDPRSIFWSMKRTQAFAYPSQNVDTFILWYKKIQELSTNRLEGGGNLLNINYENFLENFYVEKKIINKFIGQNNSLISNFDLEHSKKNLYKAKYKLQKYELKKIESKLKKYLTW
tara:strand:+ start:7251 stop:8198 length:948 start_codon:yes stop_codon:yes gene_type:complete